MERVVPINANLLKEISTRKEGSKAIHGFVELEKLADFIRWQWTMQRTIPWGYSGTRILAIHINIERSDHKWTIMRRKAVYAFIALFSPEIVVLSAYLQWKQAKTVHKSFEQVHDDLPKDDPTAEREPNFIVSTLISIMFRNLLMRKKISWFLVMGGVEIGKKHILTPLGAQLMMKSRHWEALDPKLIEDKGNADFVAKLIVCLQAAWTIVQCMLRKLEGLPVTLIELNALIHVICASLLYAFCKISIPIRLAKHARLTDLGWCKPLNVVLPMDITSLKSGVEHPADKKLGDVLFACQMKSVHNIRVKLLEERPDFMTGYQLKRSNSNESHESFHSDNTLVDNNDDEKRRFLPQNSNPSMIKSYYKTGVLQ
jgi:hypothetical protein